MKPWTGDPAARADEGPGLEPGVPGPRGLATAMVRTEGLRNFKKLVSGLGGDPALLLHKYDVEPGAVDDRDGIVPHRSAVQLLELAAQKLNCPDLGMRLAAAQEGTKVLGPLDVAMRSSPTLGHALRYCAEHVHSYSTAILCSFERLPDDRRIFMRLEILLPGLAQVRQAEEHALALTQHVVELITGGQAHAHEVWLRHEPLAPMAAYRSHLKAPVRFGQSMNGLFFEAQDFDITLPGADPQLYEIATSFIDHPFPTAAMTVSTRVRNVITRLLAEGECTHERVASALGLHPRTLQRRLREEGESFQAIKDSVRRDLALRYLRQPNASLVRLTEILGYSETSVLSRSCHRWFSISPRQLRNDLSR